MMHSLHVWSPDLENSQQLMHPRLQEFDISSPQHNWILLLFYSSTSQIFPFLFLALSSALEHMEHCFTSGDPKAKGCADPVSTKPPCHFDQIYCYVYRRVRQHPPPSSSPPNIHLKEKKKGSCLRFTLY